MEQCLFDEAGQPNTQPTEPNENHLPGYPRVPLHDGSKLLNFLERHLFSSDLDQIADKLWWMSKQDSKNISPLHRQYVKSRRIILTEDPKLHLVWIKDRIFIKPLPEYLLSPSFWTADILGPSFPPATSTAAATGTGTGTGTASRNPTSASSRTAQRTRIRQSALGLLRTYSHLIQHRSDFRIAQSPSLVLVPPELSWPAFGAFIARFDADAVRDADVSPRYAYGEIRLTRLNFYAKFLSRRWYFHRLVPQYEDYFARFYAPVLFVFGFLSIVLSALQVEISVEGLDVSGSGPPTAAPAPVAAGAGAWGAFRMLSRVVTVVSLFFGAGLTVVLGGLFLLKFGKEWRYALADRYVHRRDIHEGMRERHRAGKEVVKVEGRKQPV